MNEADEPRNYLGELIDDVKGWRPSWSDQVIADRAVRAGHQLSKANISRIRMKPIRMVVPEQIRALAEGLKMRERPVLVAALLTLGLSEAAVDVNPEDLTPEEAIESDYKLSPGTKGALLAVLAAARAAPPELKPRYVGVGPVTYTADVTDLEGGLGSSFQDRQDSVSPAVPPNGGSSVLRGVEDAGQLDDATPAGDDQNLETGMIIVDDDAPGAAAESKARAARKRADAPVEPNRSVGRRRRSGGSG